MSAIKQRSHVSKALSGNSISFEQLGCVFSSKDKVVEKMLSAKPAPREQLAPSSKLRETVANKWLTADCGTYPCNDHAEEKEPTILSEFSPVEESLKALRAKRVGVEGHLREARKELAEFEATDEGMSLSGYRLALGLSQGELSQKSGVTQAMISKIENGQKDPQASTIMKLVGVLNISYDQFFMAMSISRGELRG